MDRLKLGGAYGSAATYDEVSNHNAIALALMQLITSLSMK